MREAEDIAKYVWKHPLTDGVSKIIPIPTRVVHWIREKTSSLASQQLLFAAWFQSEVVGGPFYFGYNQMRELTGLAKDTTDKAINALRNGGILVIESEYSHSKGILSSKSRRYRIVDESSFSRVVSPIVTIGSHQWSSQLWFQLLMTLFTVHELKDSYPFAYHRIVKTSTIRIGKVSA